MTRRSSALPSNNNSQVSNSEKDNPYMDREFEISPDVDKGADEGFFIDVSTDAELAASHQLLLKERMMADQGEGKQPGDNGADQSPLKPQEKGPEGIRSSTSKWKAKSLTMSERSSDSRSGSPRNANNKRLTPKLEPSTPEPPRSSRAEPKLEPSTPEPRRSSRATPSFREDTTTFEESESNRDWLPYWLSCQLCQRGVERAFGRAIVDAYPHSVLGSIYWTEGNRSTHF
eukprot:g63193.t1